MVIYTGKVFEQGDWLGKAILELETEEGLVITFIRYSYHHKKWSLEHIYEKTFIEMGMSESNYFPDDKPKDICICGWID